MHYKHLFGPVNSRRLGISLGVDLTPLKTCTLDCVYCECGKTTALTLERREWVDPDSVIAELDHFLTPGPTLDFVTFAGSGEPTLNSGLGRVAGHVRKHFPNVRTALLTNGTLFTRPEVRLECLGFNMVAPSLDAVSDEVFAKVNRCHASLENSAIIEGLVAFSREFTGQLWLEVFIVPGVNDTAVELALFKEAITRINPGRVQLNSLDRPAAYPGVVPASPERLAQIAVYLLPLPVEIISRAARPPCATVPEASVRDIIRTTCSRRPGTVEELAVLCGSTINEMNALLAVLIAQNTIESRTVAGIVFYSVV